MIKIIDKEDIPCNYRHPNRAINDIKEFIQSGASAAEVFSDTAKNGLSLYNSYLYAARRNGFPVRTIRRGDRVFLIREDNANA